MNEMRIKRWASCYLFAALSVAASGCYGTDEMHAADTNTNWLRTCEGDDDCQGALSCISGLCTIACQQDAVCDAFGPGAECAELPDETSACDLTCEGDSSCRAVDPALGCVEGHCREQAESDGGTDAGSDAETPPDPIDAATPMDSFDGEDEVTLSSAARQGGSPQVIWTDDRWVVAWHSSPFYDAQTEQPTSGPGALDVVELTAAGVSATHRIDRPDNLYNEAIGINEANEVAVRNIVGDGCALEIVDWQTGDSESIDGPCTEGAANVANVPGTAEWIVAMADDTSVKSGRYSAADGWLTELQVVGERGDATAVAAAARSDAATIVWGDMNGSLAYTTSDIATFPPGTPTPFVGAVHDDGHYGLLQLDDRALVMGSLGGLWTTVLSPGIEPQRIALMEEGVVDMPPSMIWIDDLDLAAVCFNTGKGPETGAPGSTDTVGVAFLDRDGVAAHYWIDTAVGVREVAGCDLAWSGDQLLIAWWELERRDSAPPASLVRAKLVDWPL